MAGETVAPRELNYTYRARKCTTRVRPIKRMKVYHPGPVHHARRHKPSAAVCTRRCLIRRRRILAAVARATKRKRADGWLMSRANGANALMSRASLPDLHTVHPHQVRRLL